MKNFKIIALAFFLSCVAQGLSAAAADNNLGFLGSLLNAVTLPYQQEQALRDLAAQQVRQIQEQARMQRQQADEAAWNLLRSTGSALWWLGSAGFHHPEYPLLAAASAFVVDNLYPKFFPRIARGFGSFLNACLTRRPSYRAGAFVHVNIS